MSINVGVYRGLTLGPIAELRWLVVLEQEWRVHWASRMFRTLLVLALLQPVLRLIQVFLGEFIRNSPGSLAAKLLENVFIGYMGPRMLLEYLEIQSWFVFLLMLFAGAGAIGNDIRNNLTDVYFSKPLRWSHYVLGKAMLQFLLGLATLAVPALAMILLHCLLSPGATPARDLAWMALATVASSVLIVLPAALMFLAASALARSQAFAAVAVVAFTLVCGTTGGLLTFIGNEKSYMAVSIPMSLNRIAEQLLLGRGEFFALSWTWCLAYCVAVSILAGVVLVLRVRKLEVRA